MPALAREQKTDGGFEINTAFTAFSFTAFSRKRASPLPKVARVLRTPTRVRQPERELG